MRTHDNMLSKLMLLAAAVLLLLSAENVTASNLRLLQVRELGNGGYGTSEDVAPAAAPFADQEADAPAGEYGVLETGLTSLNVLDCPAPCNEGKAMSGLFQNSMKEKKLPPWLPKMVPAGISNENFLMDLFGTVLTSLATAGACGNLVRTGGQILGSAPSPMKVGSEATAQACSLMKVDQLLSYWSMPVPEFKAGPDMYGLCAAFRPCSDTFDFVLGIGQCTLDGSCTGLDVEIPAFPGVSISGGINSIGVSSGGNLVATSEQEVMLLQGEWGENWAPQMNGHFSIDGGMSFEAGFQAGGGEAATVGVRADASLTVDLDPNKDGLGGKDHSVMIEGTSEFYIQFADQMKFNLGGETAGVLFWSADGKGNFQGYLGSSVGMSLEEFSTDIGQDNAAGKMIHSVISKFDASVEVETQVSVEKVGSVTKWGVRLELGAEVKLPLMDLMPKELKGYIEKKQPDLGDVLDGVSIRTGLKLMGGSGENIRLEYTINDKAIPLTGLCLHGLMPCEDSTTMFCNYDLKCTKKYSTGQDCLRDEACMTGSCAHNGAFQKKRCKDQRENGHTCTDHDTCASHHCKFPEAKCAPKMSKGKACTRDNACESGKCHRKWSFKVHTGMQECA